MSQKTKIQWTDESSNLLKYRDKTTGKTEKPIPIAPGDGGA